MGWNQQQNENGTMRFLSTEDQGATPADVEIGRGVTDTDITYIALRNASGAQVYIYPDASGTAVTVSTTKP